MANDQNHLGQMMVDVTKRDFIFPGFFAKTFLNERPLEEVTAVREWLVSCLDLFKMVHGVHPELATLKIFGRKHTTLTHDKPKDDYTDEELETYEAAEPWECFPGLYNNISVFERIFPYKHEKQYAGLFDEAIEPLILAILISDTPKTPLNYHSIVSASQRLAAIMLVDRSEQLERKMLADALLKDSLSSSQRQKAGRQKGAQIRAAQKIEEGKITVAKFEFHYRDCLRTGKGTDDETLHKESGIGISTIQKLRPKLREKIRRENEKKIASSGK